MNNKILVLVTVLVFLLPAIGICSDSVTDVNTRKFPPSLASYDDAHLESIPKILQHRIRTEPLNLIVTIIFFCAILHTFLTTKFLFFAHKWELEHKEKIKNGLASKQSVSIPAGIFHFLGEVEVVFGIWVIILCVAIFMFYDWHTVFSYINHSVNFTESMFVVVIMILASTRPIIKLAEMLMSKIANVIGGTLAAWWYTILTIGPLLGSLITEPATMTISALLLAHKFYDLEPSVKFKYATIGLLFVNVSVGGDSDSFCSTTGVDDCRTMELGNSPHVCQLRLEGHCRDNFSQWDLLFYFS